VSGKPPAILFSTPLAIERGARPRGRELLLRHRAELIVAALLAAISVTFVELTRTLPAYDAFGWLTWGQEALHGNLNTDGAPSWKPVTFLFTLPYALAGRTQMSLWVWTSVAAAFAGCALAGRIAYRLTSPAGEHSWAATAAAVFAAVGVFGMADYTHLILITSSDPLVMTLCLAAIESHLSGRPRLAFAFIVLAGLGRPEAWPFALLYALWCWRSVPSNSVRWLTLVGLLLIPVLWFTVPALTARSAFISGDLALGQKTVIHGSKLIGVITRLRNLEGWPLELGTVAALALAVYRRDPRPLVLAGLAALWVAIEYAFALHGWSAVPRYLIEPAAVMVILGGAALGQALAATPRKLLDPRWAAPVLGLAMVALLIPYASRHERTVRAQVDLEHGYDRELDRLGAVVDRLGGARAIRACGQPVTFVGKQSLLAWELGMNVGEVGYRPGKEIHNRIPVVVFKPHKLGWRVRTYNIPPSRAAQCARLDTDSTFG
jgi:hypothetical protein